jgi:NADH-quinone oxidoreductase subunit C
MVDDQQPDRQGGERSGDSADNKPAEAKPAPPKAAAKKPVPPKKPKAPTTMETTPWDDELTAQLKERFGDKISEYSVYREQKFLVAAPDAAVPILEYLKTDAAFDYLVDVTAVDHPKDEKRFEVVYILYSFARNDRIRIKTRVKDGEKTESAVSVHLTANWLEREVYDMFGVEFANHPDLKRILMPDEWEGHPLRKDTGITEMDNKWVRDNIGIESAQ